MLFRNVSPLGDLDITGIGHVAAGEVFDGPDNLASQVENFTPVDPSTPVGTTSEEQS